MTTASRDIILFQTRTHPLRTILSGIGVTCLLVFPISVLFYFSVHFSFFGAVIFFLLLLVGEVSYLYSQWSHSRIYLTNERIVFSLWHGIFSHSFGNVAYEKIDDIEIAQDGLLLWKYGSLRILSQEGTQILLSSIPRVGELHSLIRILMKYTPEERRGIRNVRELHEMYTGKAKRKGEGGL